MTYRSATWVGNSPTEQYDDATRLYMSWGPGGVAATRPYTAAENAATDARAVKEASDAAARAQILDAARAALQTNRDFLAAATAGTLTNAQVVAQVVALTRQNIKIIRTVINDYTGTD